MLTGVPNYPQGKIYKEYKINKKKFKRFKSIDIIRVPIIPRGSNYFTLFFKLFKFYNLLYNQWYFYFKKKKYDRIFFFATSPIFSAIPAIIIGKIKKFHFQFGY